MFDLKREFEEQQNSSEIITYEYGLDPVSDFLLDSEIKEFEEGARKLEVLNNVDAACLAFETALLSNEESVSYETALSDFNNVIVQNGFTLTDFGFDSESLSKESALLTVESAEGNENLFKKIWNWIKQKAEALWEWLKEKWNLFFGKTSKLDQVANELEKQIENIPEGGFSKESGLTHEAANKAKLYFKDISSVPGAALFINVKEYADQYAKYTDPKFIAEATDEISKAIEKYIVAASQGKEVNYGDTVKKLVEEIKAFSAKAKDVTLKYTDYKPGQNEFLSSAMSLSGNTVKVCYVSTDDSATTLKDAIKFHSDRSGNIKSNISPDKELKLLDKKELLATIKSLKSIIALTKTTIDGLKKGVEKNSTMRKSLEEFVKNVSPEEKRNAIDIGNYTMASAKWMINNSSAPLNMAESALRVLAVHTKKHYVNQH